MRGYEEIYHDKVNNVKNHYTIYEKNFSPDYVYLGKQICYKNNSIFFKENILISSPFSCTKYRISFGGRKYFYL